MRHKPTGGPSLPLGSLAPAPAAAESTMRLQSPDCPMRGRVALGLPAAPLPPPCLHGGAGGSLAGSLAAFLGFVLRGPPWGCPRGGGRLARATGLGGGEAGLLGQAGQQDL